MNAQNRRLAAVQSPARQAAQLANEANDFTPTVERALAYLAQSGLLSDPGLTIAEKVLWAFLRVASRDFSQKELCDGFGLSRATIHRTTKRLEALDLVTDQRIGLGQPNKRTARNVEQAAVDAVDRNARRANAAALGREERARRRVEKLGTGDPQLFELPKPTPTLGIQEAFAALARDVGTNFTRRQVRDLERAHKAMLRTVVLDWYEHRHIAKERFGELAAKTVARYIRDAEAVPDDLRVSKTRSPKAPRPYVPSDGKRELDQAYIPTEIPESIRQRAAALGITEGTPQFYGLLRSMEDE